jgi:hypothetical protein
VGSSVDVDPRGSGDTILIKRSRSVQLTVAHDRPSEIEHLALVFVEGLAAPRRPPRDALRQKMWNTPLVQPLRGYGFLRRIRSLRGANSES